MLARAWEGPFQTAPGSSSPEPVALPFNSKAVGGSSARSRGSPLAAARSCGHGLVLVQPQRPFDMLGELDRLIAVCGKAIQEK